MDDAPTPFPEATAEADCGEVVALKVSTKKPRMSVVDVTTRILDAIAPGKKKANDDDDASEPGAGKKDGKKDGKGKGTSALSCDGWGMFDQKMARMRVRSRPLLSWKRCPECRWSVWS